MGVEVEDFCYSRERQLYPRMAVNTWYQLWIAGELVSPILTENNWGEVEAIMKAIQIPPVAVIHNKSTSTHIHIGIQPHSVAPLDSETGLYDLKRVAAVFYIFEIYLNLLCPHHRVNDWCHRVRRSYFGRRGTQREFCETISNLQNLRELHTLMNCPNLDIDGIPYSSRYYGGNFANCMNVWEKWTVEFRSHEGTKNYAGLQSWGKLLLRLFDQAVAADWDFIIDLCDTTESFNMEGTYGDTKSRGLSSWRNWVASMHVLFVMFLAGPVIRSKHMNMVDLPAMENYILSQPPQMTDEEYADDDVRYLREEEMLLQNLFNFLLARENKFSSQYEAYMQGNFEDWSSDNPRDDLPGDYVDYPNPSGIVRDQFGKDIPVDMEGQSSDYAQYPAA